MALLSTLTLLTLTAAASIEACGQSSSDKSFPWLLELGLSSRLTGRGNEPQSNISIDSGGNWETSRLLTPKSKTLIPTAIFSLTFEVQKHNFSVRLDMDSGVLQTGASLSPSADSKIVSDGQDPSQTLFAGSTVRDLAISYAGTHFSFDIGRRYNDLGEGLLYRDYGTGATLSLHSDKMALQGWRLDLAVQTLGNTLDDLKSRAPFGWLELSYLPSLFESVSLYAARFQDHGNRLGEVLASSRAETVVGLPREQVLLDNLFSATSSGHINYLGTSGLLIPADRLSLRWSAAGSFGTTTLQLASATREFSIRGYAATASLQYGVGSQSGVGTFVLILSGSDVTSQQRGNYTAFIGPAPFWTWTGLFFTGGVNQGIYPGRSVAAGVNGHGVQGAGLRAETVLGDFLLQSRIALLLAASPSNLAASQGSFYGTECDVIVRRVLSDYVSFTFELDVLRTGSFFPSHKLAYRALGQIDVVLGL